MTRPTLAFVTPWYGPIPGGMEALTRHTAEHLAARGWPVEILTTTIRDFYADWSHNHHTPGVRHENGVLVRRFAVQKRDKAAFDALNMRLIQGLPITAAQEQTFIQEFVRTPDLYAHMAQRTAETLFFCTPYLFPTTYFGGQIAPQRTIHIPCLHDEAYAHLQLQREVFPPARALIFLAQPEQALAERLFGPALHQIRVVIGSGIETNFTADPARFRATYNLGQTPFLLYAGRREPGKNTPLLLDYWARMVRAGQVNGRLLLLIGSGEVNIPPDVAHTVRDLGFVPVQDKYDAYAAAVATCQPSVHESFSIVIMESWVAGRPVLVHGQCAVTKDYCVQSNGGLYFNNYDEFVATFDYLCAQPATAAHMGHNGREYVLRHFQWDTVLDQYEALIAAITH